MVFRRAYGQSQEKVYSFYPKDGVKTLASKLRTHNKLMSEKEPNTEEKVDSEETVDEEKASNLTFDQQLQLLQLERQIRMEEREAQNYEESKSIIIKGYQFTADHYRYRFRTSEKKPGEDFVQWGYRTERYLNRWMAVAEATGDVEKILEQFMIECLLDAVNPELRVWLKEQKPKTADELGNLANLHVQSQKGPLVEGRHASFGKNKGGSI